MAGSAAPGLLLSVALTSAAAAPAPELSYDGRPLGHWLAVLSEPTVDWEDRQRAARAIAGLLGDPATRSAAEAIALPALADLLRSVASNPQAAERAAVALAVSGPRAASAVSPLVGVLNRRSGDPAQQAAQEAAARALVAIGDARPVVVQVLGSSAVGSPGSGVRAESLDALRLLAGAEQSVPLLTRALSDPAGEVRWIAALGLAEIGAPARPAVAALQALLSDEASHRVQSRFLAWVQQLFPLYSDDYRCMAAAAAALVAVGEVETGLPALRQHLRHDDWVVRNAALEATWSARGAGAGLVVPLLADRLEDPLSEVRRKALQLLARLGRDAQGAWDPVTERALQDPDPTVRLAALDAFLALRPHEPDLVVPLLANRLEDPTPLVRERAAVLLGELGPRAGDALPELRQALADPDPSVRDSAKRAVHAVSRRSGPGSAPPR